MPTYEYICEACGHEFEQFQSIKADPITLCPTCGKEQVRRKISAGAGILFKGGGFYETDYRSAGYKESAKKDSEAGGAKGDGKSDGKSESKSESKSDAPAKSETKSEGKSTGSDAKPAAESAKPAAKSDSPSAKPSKSES
ncbi:MAG TPA: zinc ribbon domain-containing protein [Tepidisphaeraceae bacterium]|jgi:putative FmdB family regulatory protein